MNDLSSVSATAADGRPVSLLFQPDEYAGRLAAARAELRRRGLDALLVFAQESHYYLTGYFTGGFCFFQVGIVTADDSKTVLLTRIPDKLQATVASLYDDIRTWLNAEDVNPADQMREIMDEMGLKGGRIGVEYDTHGLTGYNAKRVEAALDGFCTLADASDLVRCHRLVKSPAELAIMRRSGQLADMAVQAVIDTAAPGKLSSELNAAALTAMLKGGGDASGVMINTGSRALFGRGMNGPQGLGETDQILVELAGSCKRYTVVIEHTLAVGEPDPRQLSMMDVTIDALEQVKDAARPGAQLGTLDDIHRRVLDAAGFEDERYAACGYAMGGKFGPSWMDVPPMIYSGNPLILEPGMVFFVHIMLPDRRTGLTAGVGQSFVITDGAPEVLSEIPLQLHRC